MKEAIQKAIEGGWDIHWVHAVGISEVAERHSERVLLDPTFWQALGKSLGWKETAQTGLYKDGYAQIMSGWKYNWLLFINHLAEGKDPDDYFNQLLK